MKCNSLATVEDMMLGESAAKAAVDNEVENAATVAASTGIDLEKMRLSFFMGTLPLGQLGFANSTGGGVGGGRQCDGSRTAIVVYLILTRF